MHAKVLTYEHVARVGLSILVELFSFLCLLFPWRVLSPQFLFSVIHWWDCLTFQDLGANLPGISWGELEELRRANSQRGETTEFLNPTMRRQTSLQNKTLWYRSYLVIIPSCLVCTRCAKYPMLNLYGRLWNLLYANVVIKVLQTTEKKCMYPNCKFTPHMQHDTFSLIQQIRDFTISDAVDNENATKQHHWLKEEK